MHDLSSRLGRIRELADDIAQGELGMLCGLNRSHVRLLESGARRSPGLTTLTKISNTLDVSFTWLATGEGDEPTAEAIRAAVGRARRKLARRKLAGKAA